MKLYNYTFRKHVIAMPKEYFESEVYNEEIDRLMKNHWKNLREFGGPKNGRSKRSNKPSNRS